MPRFFLDRGQIGESSLVLRGDDAHHISYSLRMAVGDEITVCDGEGTEYLCSLSAFDGDTVTASILSRQTGKTESPVNIRLYMAYPKGDKLETVVQKAVELGACRILPFESERCVKRPHAEKAEKQTARLTRIATEAAKQCGRSRLPSVSTPITFSDVLKDDAELRIFCYEGEGAQSLRALLEGRPMPKTVSVVIGSEGGFSPAEASAAEDAGFLLANLGPRILRCETAPEFALSAFCYRWEL